VPCRHGAAQRRENRETFSLETVVLIEPVSLVHEAPSSDDRHSAGSILSCSSVATLVGSSSSPCGGTGDDDRLLTLLPTGDFRTAAAAAEEEEATTAGDEDVEETLLPLLPTGGDLVAKTLCP
jgi:hypothetical protein